MTKSTISDVDGVNESEFGLKQRFDEMPQTINSRDSLLEEFDEEIFNALVEKIEILTPTRPGNKLHEAKKKHLLAGCTFCSNDGF